MAVPKIPAGAPAPQDRKPKKASPSTEVRIAETADDNGKFVTVEQCGVELRIPVGDNMPLEAVIEFTTGNDFAGTAALLGEEQWAAFRAAKPTLADYNELGSKLKAAAGN